MYRKFTGVDAQKWTLKLRLKDAYEGKDVQENKEVYSAPIEALQLVGTSEKTELRNCAAWIECAD